MASFEGQIMIDLENIVKKYPGVPMYVWKNALRETLYNSNFKKQKGFNIKWTQFVKDNYVKTKKEMGGDHIKRIDVLIRLSHLYRMSE